MEQNDNIPDKNKNEDVTAEISVSDNKMTVPSKIKANICRDFIKILDLSGQIITALNDDEILLPTELVYLNLSHNKLVKVSNAVQLLGKLVMLNLSHDTIEHFDNYSSFCHTLEHLDISYNNLVDPPCWVWTESPQKLAKLNLSNNSNITKPLGGCYIKELSQQYNNGTIPVVNEQNCKLNKFTELLGTFSKATMLCLGDKDCSHTANIVTEVPCQGLDKCCNLKTLEVCNTQIYINPSIAIHKCLTEINLAQNKLNRFPVEFCNLENLKICILSFNKISYLPEEICKMQKLSQLHLDSNAICMLPESLSKLVNLKTLDVYDNNIHVMPNYENYKKLDLALNYFEEPNDKAYLKKKKKLRLLHRNRFNGCKYMITSDDDFDEDSSCQDDEESYEILYNGKRVDSPSSPEVWECDDYLIPSHLNPFPTQQPLSVRWIMQKIEEGDYYSQVSSESDRQFVDSSSDES